MIKETRIFNYALYAIGEIILVVIGILIALQINTWSKANQNKELEQTSLENLKEDLLIQTEIIQEQIAYEALAIAQVDSSLSYLTAGISLIRLNELLNKLTSRHTFVANKATYINMGATGSVVLIHDPKLQNLMVRYYQQLDYTTAVVNNNNLFLIDNQYGTFINTNSLHFRLAENGLVDESHQLNPEELFSLERALQGRNGASESILNLCNRQLKSTESLIEEISKFLSQE